MGIPDEAALWLLRRPEFKKDQEWIEGKITARWGKFLDEHREHTHETAATIIAYAMQQIATGQVTWEYGELKHLLLHLSHVRAYKVWEKVNRRIIRADDRHTKVWQPIESRPELGGEEALWCSRLPTASDVELVLSIIKVCKDSKIKHPLYGRLVELARIVTCDPDIIGTKNFDNKSIQKVFSDLGDPLPIGYIQDLVGKFRNVVRAVYKAGSAHRSDKRLKT